MTLFKRNNNIIFIIIILLTLILIELLIIPKTYKTNTGIYNDLIITQKEYEKIIGNREFSKDLKLTNLKFNSYDLFLDDSSNTYYYSLIENNKNAYNPKISYKSDHKNLKLSIVDNKITDKLIENNQSTIIIIYTDKLYYIYNLTCTTLPLMNINYNINNDLSREMYTNMKTVFFDNRDKVTNRYIKSDGEIKVRGATSSYYPKRSLTIKFKKYSTGNNKRNNDINILGLGKSSKWIMYAGYDDQEKVRNVFSNNLWYYSCAKNNSFGITNGIEFKHIELFINGEYWGLYAIALPVDEKQLQIKPGEYLFKKIDWINSEAMYQKDSSTSLAGYEIKNDKYNYNEAWKTLNNYYYKIDNSNDLKDLYNLSDINNMIDYYLFNNFIQGVDNSADVTSKNMFISFKYKNNNLVSLYTPWDFNYTFGNTWTNDSKNCISQYTIAPDYNIEFKFNPLGSLQKLNDSNINDLIKERYAYLRSNDWSEEYLINMIDDLEIDIFDSGAYYRDNSRWPDTTYSPDTDRLNLFKNYVLKRLTYMDEFVNNLE